MRRMMRVMRMMRMKRMVRMVRVMMTRMRERESERATDTQRDMVCACVGVCACVWGGRGVSEGRREIHVYTCVAEGRFQMMQVLQTRSMEPTGSKLPYHNKPIITSNIRKMETRTGSGNSFPVPFKLCEGTFLRMPVMTRPKITLSLSESGALLPA